VTMDTHDASGVARRRSDSGDQNLPRAGERAAGALDGAGRTARLVLPFTTS
jgi:hypothetical protein